MSQQTKFGKLLEDGLPFLIVALGIVASYVQQDPKWTAYSVPLAILIKTGKSLVAANPQTPAAAATVVEQSLKTNWPDIKTAILAETAKLPAGQQGYANLSVTVIDAYVSGKSPAEIAALLQKGLTGA